MNTMAEAAIFSRRLPYLSPKKSGMVLDLRCWLMTRVLLPRMTQARRLPMTAFPIPIQVEARPYFHPNWPAYPTNTTAEK